ncbi:DNA-binding core protein [Cetacean poxvirus 1]|nr:DNA-binding core protein [Cetacean poxvirus 1]
MDNNDQLVFNSINARALKTYLTFKINAAIDELVTRKYPHKKKTQTTRVENRIPIDLIQPSFVKKFCLEKYSNGVLISLVNSLVENNYFSDNGKLETVNNELMLTNTEKKILSKVSKDSSLYIDVSDVKNLSVRLKVCAKSFIYNGVVYNIENNKIEDLINSLIKTDAIYLDEKCSIKDSVYVINSDLLSIFKTRLFRCPQVKDNTITRSRLYDYFIRVIKQENPCIYVIIKDKRIADALCIETVEIGKFLYTKHSILFNAISSNIDRYTKRFNEQFYECIAEFIKDNEKVNVSRIIEYLTVQNVTIDEKPE